MNFNFLKKAKWISPIILLLISCDNPNNADEIDCNDCKSINDYIDLHKENYGVLEFLNSNNTIIYQDSTGYRLIVNKTSYSDSFIGVYSEVISDCGYCGFAYYNAYSNFVEYEFNKTYAYYDLGIKYLLDSYNEYMSLSFIGYNSIVKIELYENDIGESNYASFVDTITINNKTFYDIYIQTNEHGDIIYYNATFGLVGFNYKNIIYSLIN